MRTVAIVVVLVALTATARAEDVVGSYDAKFDQLANNCEHAQTLSHTTVRLDVKKTSLTVNIETIPQMVGAAEKSGKVTAKSKLGPSIIQGIDATYRVAGRIADGGMLQLVLIAEYSIKGKATCTQSWNIAGLRQDKSAAKP